MLKFPMIVSVCLFFPSLACAADSQDAFRWFPVQKAPSAVVHSVPAGAFERTPDPTDNNAQPTGEIAHMLVQSLCGLTAKAVNEGTLDEMIWIEDVRADYKFWHDGVVKRLGLETRGTFSPEQLLRRYADKGLIKGYILYRYDWSKGRPYHHRQDEDDSVNVATTLAGPMHAVLIEVSQEPLAQSLGLKKLFDAREKDMQWVYDNYKDKLNRNVLLTVDPKVANERGLAIAYDIAAVYGTDKITEAFCARMTAPGLILGWNVGDESEHTGLASDYGHIQTASNWAYNIWLLLADSQNNKLPRLKNIDPKTIDWNDPRTPVSYVMSDGDNLQWLMGGFFFNPSYWANPHRNRFASDWTACIVHLAQACPEALNYLAQTRGEATGIIEYGGGYHYPDRMGIKRDNRPEILKLHAQRVGRYLKEANVRVFGFLCKDVASPAAQEAYAVYAKHIEGLVGMVAFQYYPYNGGKGEVFWVKNAAGVEIPVVTGTHSIWKDAHWFCGGDPLQVAEMINTGDSCAKTQDFALIPVHAWSYFDAQQGHEGQQAERGLTPVKWSVDQLDKTRFNVVTAEELIWRLRMKHNPQQTRKLLESESN